MFYNEFKSPAIIKTKNNILGNIDALLKEAHLFFPKKILITQELLYGIYRIDLDKNDFTKVIFVQGGVIDEAFDIISQIKDTDAIILAFGGGSVLDIVKYCATKCDVPYITVPSTLSNDAIYSCVSRLTENGKKKSYGVQPPIGIIVDLDIIKKSPKDLLLAGIADLVSNLSALEDWKLAHKEIGEPINELAFMLSKESVMPMFNYHSKEDLMTDDFLLDFTNGLITSGLSMIVCGTTRVTSGAEHLISHAIDEYYPERSTIHGLQVGWAHLLIEKSIRHNVAEYNRLYHFFDEIGLLESIRRNIQFPEEEFKTLIPLAKTMRNRYTIFNYLYPDV